MRVQRVLSELLLVDGAVISSAVPAHFRHSLLAVDGLLDLVRLLAEHIVLVVDGQMVHEVSKGHHHRGGQGPAKAPGARVVVKSLEQIARVSREELGMTFEDRLNLLPLGVDL